MEVNKTRSSKYLFYALTMLWSGDTCNLGVSIDGMLCAGKTGNVSARIQSVEGTLKVN